ncbi:MAG: hypothetical protein II725_00560 [Firmicutes bacterium]|nr:hypothetical protein [Bacillota bacterium]
MAKNSKTIICAVMLLLCMILVSCNKTDTHNSIDDSLLPMNELPDVFFGTLDGTNRISIKKGTERIETTLCLKNYSEYRIDFGTEVYVRLQKKVNGNWQFADDKPYPSGPSNENMISILPGSQYEQIPVSIGIDNKKFDYDGEYRLYLPIEFSPKGASEKVDPSQRQKACLTVPVSLEIR